MTVSILPKTRSLNHVFADRLDREVLLIEFIPASSGDKFDLTFEQAQSDWRQGVWLGSDGTIEIAGSTAESMRIWTDSAPSTVRIKIGEASAGLFLYNIWDRGNGPQSQAHTSGMVVDEIENGWRYSCQSIGLDPLFEDICFRVERVR